MSKSRIRSSDFCPSANPVFLCLCVYFFYFSTLYYRIRRELIANWLAWKYTYRQYVVGSSNLNSLFTLSHRNIYGRNAEYLTCPSIRRSEFFFKTLSIQHRKRRVHMYNYKIDLLESSLLFRRPASLPWSGTRVSLKLPRYTSVYISIYPSSIYNIYLCIYLKFGQTNMSKYL